MTYKCYSLTARHKEVFWLLVFSILVRERAKKLLGIHKILTHKRILFARVLYLTVTVMSICHVC